MEKTERLGLVLTPKEKAAVTRLAELEGGLSQAALVRRLIRVAANEQGVWSLAKQNQSMPGGSRATSKESRT